MPKTASTIRHDSCTYGYRQKLGTHSSTSDPMCCKHGGKKRYLKHEECAKCQHYEQPVTVPACEACPIIRTCTTKPQPLVCKTKPDARFDKAYHPSKEPKENTLHIDLSRMSRQEDYIRRSTCGNCD